MHDTSFVVHTKGTACRLGIIAVNYDGLRYRTPTIDLGIIERTCPLLAAAFEPSDRLVEKFFIEETLPDAVIALLRFAYTSDYMPNTADAANFALPIRLHLEVYLLGRNFDVKPLQTQAYTGVIQWLELGFCTTGCPLEPVSTIRLAYTHCQEDVKLLSSLLNYCAINLIRHGLLFDKDFISLLNDKPVFYQDLCVANMSHAYTNDGAQTLLQIGAHCKAMELSPSYPTIEEDHPFYPGGATTVLSRVPPARRALLQSLLGTPEATAAPAGLTPWCEVNQRFSKEAYDLSDAETDELRSSVRQMLYHRPAGKVISGELSAGLETIDSSTGSSSPDMTPRVLSVGAAAFEVTLPSQVARISSHDPWLAATPSRESSQFSLVDLDDDTSRASRSKDRDEFDFDYVFL